MMSSKAERRSPRIDLRREAWLTNSDGGKFPIRILDVSAGGFRMEVPEPVRIGELVTVMFDRNYVVQAAICWVIGDEAGASFVTLSDTSLAS